jgi:hypothetical protein
MEEVEGELEDLGERVHLEGFLYHGYVTEDS